MKYTNEQQEKAIVKASKELKLDAHIFKPQYKKDLHTWADQIAKTFFRKDIPIKKSYMYCDSLDMDFFFREDEEAIYTYSGYADKRDSGKKLIEAFELADKMRLLMQKYIESEE